MRTFDVIFENEREKETFYMECMVRCLMMSLNNNNEEDSTTMKKQRMDEIKTCRVTRAISQIRKALNDSGRINKLPRSAVCVDEDFHYLRGRNGANDDSLRNNLQSWPEHSVFEARDFTTPELNPTLSLTSRMIEIEKLKQCLFMDSFKSRSKFMILCENGRSAFTTNEDEYFCCGCEYDAKCAHFNNSNLTESTLTYLTSTCPICVFMITKSCGKNEDDCCIKRMEDRDGFVNLQEAVDFSTNCYHFLYERHYINFCIEGNLFENGMRHIIRYFNSLIAVMISLVKG